MDRIGLTAFILFLFSQLCVFFKLEPFFTWFYLFAWWSYIFIVDSIIFKSTGNSLIRSREKEIIILSGWSIIFWLIFESVNLLLENWYYVNLPVNTYLRRTGILLAFATVLPAVFETTELLSLSNVYKKITINRFKCFSSLPVLLFAVGILFAFLSIAIPHYFFPLIWGSFTLILEPILYFIGGKSLLKDLENGNVRKILLLLTAGLVCGFLWEFWNYWAHSKWIYTLPIVNQAKLFEMPIAGYIGFPLLSIDCYVMYNFVSFFRNGKSWEKAVDPTAYFLPKPIKIVFVPIAMTFFAFAVINMMEKYTIDSYESYTKDVPGISLKDYIYLSDKGLSKIYKFIQFCEKTENIERIAKELNYSNQMIQKWIKFSKLIDFKGIGIKNFLILREIGIDSIADLSKADPEWLYKKFGSTKPRGRLKHWIDEAEKLVNL